MHMREIVDIQNTTPKNFFLLLTADIVSKMHDRKKLVPIRHGKAGNHQCSSAPPESHSERKLEQRKKNIQVISFL